MDIKANWNTLKIDKWLKDRQTLMEFNKGIENLIKMKFFVRINLGFFFSVKIFFAFVCFPKYVPMRWDSYRPRSFALRHLSFFFLFLYLYQCFFYWQIFAKIRLEKCDFDQYKGFFIGKMVENHIDSTTRY
jgi:hypothetical protein